MPTSDPTAYTVPVLEVGDLVQTPDGPAEVVSIRLVGGVYANGTVEELEPPLVTVELLSTGEEKTVCPCELELADPQAQRVLRTSYDRFWGQPPDAPTEPVVESTVLPEVVLSFFTKTQTKIINNATEDGTLDPTNRTTLERSLGTVQTPRQVASYLKLAAPITGLHTKRRVEAYVENIITSLVFANPEAEAALERVEASLVEAIRLRFKR